MRNRGREDTDAFGPMAECDLQGVLEEEEGVSWLRIATIVMLFLTIAGYLWMCFRGIK